MLDLAPKIFRVNRSTKIATVEIYNPYLESVIFRTSSLQRPILVRDEACLGTGVCGHFGSV
jgi:hypothetical protein